MTNEVTKDLQYYCNLPYGIALRRDEEGDWVARIEELPGCVAHGGTPALALDSLEELKVAWIGDAIDAGEAIPEPKVDEGLPSGKWVQRVPRSLHKGLAVMAEKEGVSLNQLVTTLLAEALGRHRTLAKNKAARPLHLHDWGDLEARWREHRTLWGAGAWEMCSQKPALLIMDALDSHLFAIPNRIDEIDFKVTERASKKSFALK